MKEVTTEQMARVINTYKQEIGVGTIERDKFIRELKNRGCKYYNRVATVLIREGLMKHEGSRLSFVYPNTPIHIKYCIMVRDLALASTKKWLRRDFEKSTLTDEFLIEELKKRGYKVMRPKVIEFEEV